MAVPYTSTARSGTGLYNAKLGTWLFLAAEAMFFGALFSSYVFLRTAAESWPEGREILPLPFAAANTVCLVLAAAVIAQTWLRTRQGEAARSGLTVTALLGLLSAGLTVLEHDILPHPSPAANNFYGMYYLLTAVHCVHVAGGAVVTAWLAGPGRKIAASDPARQQNRIECTGLYWQFIAIVWLLIYTCFFVF